MTTEAILHRRAGALAGLLSLSIGVALAALLLLPIAMNGSIQLWVVAVRYALVAALVWALVISLNAARELRTPRIVGTTPRTTAGLIAALLTVAGWTVSGSAHALAVPVAPVAAEPMTPAPADPLMGPLPTGVQPNRPATPATAEADCAASPSPDWLPPRPPATAPADRDPLLMSCSRSAGEAPQVVVRRGDSLWSIAARQLGPDADPATIAAAVPRWHAANRAVIGPNPNLLQVGQVLTAPNGATS